MVDKDDKFTIKDNSFSLDKYERYRRRTCRELKKDKVSTGHVFNNWAGVVEEKEKNINIWNDSSVLQNDESSIGVGLILLKRIMWIYVHDMIFDVSPS